MCSFQETLFSGFSFVDMLLCHASRASRGHTKLTWTHLRLISFKNVSIFLTFLNVVVLSVVRLTLQKRSVRVLLKLETCWLLKRSDEIWSMEMSHLYWYTPDAFSCVSSCAYGTCRWGICMGSAYNSDLIVCADNLNKKQTPFVVWLLMRSDIICMTELRKVISDALFCV